MNNAEKNRRIALDFNKNLNDILLEIKQVYPDVTPEMIEKWEKEKSLEFLEIEGEKRYFRRAARNFFRINRDAKKLFIEKFGDEKQKRNDFLKNYLLKIIYSQKPDIQHFKFNFKLKINSEINEGEKLRVWLPYCRGVAHNAATSAHSSIFFEKMAKNGEKNEFEVEFEFSEKSRYKKINPDKILPYNENCFEVKNYCQEKFPHIVFSEKLHKISTQIVENERNPYLKAKQIFTWISQNIHWAAAQEYSTIDNIPEYVLENRHGDCGQVSLLFIALCRLNGVPARWQSGFMLHPNCENLHDWAEIFVEPFGWLPVDVSFGLMNWAENEDLRYFYFGNIDAFRLVVNTDISAEFEPRKKFERSETVDFQRGEVETDTRNLYFDEWDYSFNVKIL